MAFAGLAAFSHGVVVMRAVTLIAVGMLAATAAHAQPGPGPREFINDAIEGDNAEVMFGRMAVLRSRDPDIRAYGRMLQADHNQAKAQAIRVGRRYHVRPSLGLPGEAIAERRRLERMNGRAFDREFVDYMIEDHQKDIDKFQAATRFEGPAGRLAEQTLPTLRHHLDMARSLRR